jgi:hypothetical protein
VRGVALIAAGLALGIGTSAIAISRSQGHEEPAAIAEERRDRPATHEENRRILTATETRRLVRYAGALHRCLTRRGVEAARPRKDSSAITIEMAKAVGLARLVALTTSCAGPLGDPPKPSSLQAVDARTIVLSVPKQCLLDPKVET